MKKRLLVFVMLASMVSVVNVSQAKANCSAENPCGTWAVLDNQGTVTNVIVCQASVCGGGTFAGQPVVPQIAPNSQTNDPTGQGSFIGNKETGSTVTYSNGTFTVNSEKVLDRSEVSILENKTTTTGVSIPVLSNTFTYEDTIGKNYNTIPLKVGTVNSNLDTKIFVQEITKNVETVEKEIIKEVISYDEFGNQIITYVSEIVLEDKILFDLKENKMNFISQITQEQFNNTVTTSSLNLLNTKINTLLQLLSDWFIK